MIVKIVDCGLKFQVLIVKLFVVEMFSIDFACVVSFYNISITITYLQKTLKQLGIVWKVYRKCFLIYFLCKFVFLLNLFLDNN